MPTSYVYCDESHVDTHAYRVQGGIWVPETGMRAVRAAFKELRAKHPKISEFKWSYVTGREPMTVYCDLIDLFFQSEVAPMLSFRCIVIAKSDDASQLADKTGKDLGFFKAYYTLLSKRLKPGTDNHLTIDERTSPRPGAIEELKQCLNGIGGKTRPPFQVLSCKMGRSKDDDLLQLADVLCGAVAWAYNGMKSTCGAKPLLHQRICQSMNWITLDKCETDAKAPKFNVWRYRPRKR